MCIFRFLFFFLPYILARNIYLYVKWTQGRNSLVLLAVSFCLCGRVIFKLCNWQNITVSGVTGRMTL